ncbi:uncharacterized protein LOC127245853 isoform X2 [Andrographis paniculata]|uniref:uncharacterized protein LOC127245853 isoform X2 n=1 Tax=Andrographis paniculata TaxID=175694 RepID=UPI0021E7EF8A|nr:uncharacterized protein LOC127245853 isoform X2 [Andrographis paniculata]
MDLSSSSSSNSSSTCPICFRSIPSLQLQRHANDHFADEDEEKEDCGPNFVSPHQIPSIPPPPSPIADGLLECTSSWDNPQLHSSSYEGGDVDERIASLIGSWNKETFYVVEGGLMTLLKKCLELESGKTLTVLSGHVDHFQSIESWDVGWGCGWRNIQMLSSHLLSQRQESREVLFARSGFVPSIGSLQRWLELAWEKGFDTTGSKDFGQKIVGKRDWIGTTECAALFRSFGVRARIVDFSTKDFEVSWLGLGKRKSTQVYGPMDTFLSKGKLDLSPAVPSREEFRQQPNISSEKVQRGHQVLTAWIWRYFSGENANRGNHGVVLSEKAPLYFQHDGHSRTIVGIQAKYQRNGMRQYNLLVFDPAQALVVWCWILKHKAHIIAAENKGSGSIAEREFWMAEVNKEGGAHPEEATVPVVLY